MCIRVQYCIINFWRRLRALSLTLLLGALFFSSCSEGQLARLNLVLSAEGIPRGEETTLIITSDGKIPDGTLQVSVDPPDGLEFGEPTKSGAQEVTVDVSASEDAPIGARVLTLETGSGIGKTDFMVETKGDVLVELVPAETKVGTKDLTVQVKGKGTHFKETSVVFKDEKDLVVGPFKADSAESGTFTLSIGEKAVVGVRELYIVTKEAKEEVYTTFTIKSADPPPEPTIELSPTSIQAGTTRTVYITGTNTNFSAETSLAFGVGSGIAVNSIALSTSGENQVLTVGLTADKTATVGAASFDVKTPLGEDFETVKGSLQITDPAVISVSPSSAYQGDVESVQISGQHTHFVNPGTSLSIRHKTNPAATGAQIDTTQITPSTFIEANITLQEDALPGDWEIVVTADNGEDVEETVAEFTVLEVTAVPTMTASPDTGTGGQTLSVALTGTDTNFVSGTTTLTSPCASITVDSFTVNDLSQTISAQLTLDPSAVTETTSLTATTTTLSGSEVVSAPFDVQAMAACADFDLNPYEVNIGRYDTALYLTRPTPGWIPGTTTVAIDGTAAHIEADSCVVNSSSQITCNLTVGVSATLGDYEVHVTTGTEVMCAILTVNPDSTVAITSLPTGGLPGVVSQNGTLDPASGDRSDFYSFTVAAGDTWVFHVFSNDRATLDPVLRLIDTTGDDWLVYKNDETALGIDSRIVYHFTTAGQYYIEVGPFLSWDTGSYTLYIHELTHGSSTAETTASNDAAAQAQTISITNPVLIYGTSASDSDPDFYQFTVTDPVAIDVAARRLGPWQGSTSDLTVNLYTPTDLFNPVDWNSTWNENPMSADPRLFIETAGTYYLETEPETGSSGFYALNIRPIVVINEVDNRIGALDPFVELVGPADFDLSGYQLCAYNASCSPVDSSNECVSLTGFSTATNGYFAAFHDMFSETTLLLPDGAGAVVLKYGTTTIDAVQYGDISGGCYAEGNFAEIGETRTIGRGAEVDTNNNDIDFIYMANPTPGQPNDRTCQAAVPLFGENAG